MGDTTMTEYEVPRFEPAPEPTNAEVWEQVRQAYVRPVRMFGHYGENARQKRYDAALAAHDAEVAAAALREAGDILPEGHSWTRAGLHTLADRKSTPDLGSEQ